MRTAQKMFARRNAHSLPGNQLNIFGHFIIEYVCAWYHAIAQPNGLSTRAQAHKSVSLTHLQLEASSAHALVQKSADASYPMRRWRSHQSHAHAQQSARCLVCAAKGHINPLPMRSKVRRCIMPRAQLNASSTPCASAAKCAVASCLMHSWRSHQPMRMRSNVRRCLMPHAQPNASVIHAHAQQCAPLPRAACAAEGLIIPLRMRSKVRVASYAQLKGTSIPCACAAMCADASRPMRSWRLHQSHTHAQQVLHISFAWAASVSASHKSLLCFFNLARKWRYFRGALWLNNSH